MGKELEKNPKNKIEFDFNDRLFVYGTVAIVGGAYFIYAPASPVVFGIILIYLAIKGDF